MVRRGWAEAVEGCEDVDGSLGTCVGVGSHGSDALVGEVTEAEGAARLGDVAKPGRTSETEWTGKVAGHGGALERRKVSFRRR